MKKIQFALLIATLVSLLAITAAFAQTEELSLRMSRDFGYGGFNNDIQGLFSMKVTGPADLARVVFYINSIVIGEVTQAPFNLQFNTDNYPLGQLCNSTRIITPSANTNYMLSAIPRADSNIVPM
ncbi:MAG: hypothetical protein NTW99_16290 [Chloroflexi bacterium]|nr:hypothetical protein [Chloroflexota bacterium]